jgi:hypothetical protein
MSVVQRGVRSRELPPPQLTLFSRDRATIDERTMLVERGNSPMFYVTINPTVGLLPVPPPAPLDGIGWCTHEVITPWPHMPSLIPVGSGYRTILPTAMIRHMVGVLAR